MAVRNVRVRGLRGYRQHVETWREGKYSAYSERRPVNINFILPVWGILGPAWSVTYLPLTKNVCVAGGLGASIGRNISAGFLSFGNIFKAKEITEGPSISVGAQFTHARGVQATGNFSGVLGGPTVGTPGGSVSATVAGCI